ncbi:MAG: LacI family DNA-binding transcriptional regulator [Planctomycetota bacterium]|jgi:LacI family transcriptional regulator
MNAHIPNLKDVAKQAGVSKSTASRILNDRMGNGFSVRAEVRQRVLEAAKKLKYRPNLIAQSLTQQSMQMIHVFGGNHALKDLGNIYQTAVNHLTRVIDSVSPDYDVTVDMSHHGADSSELPAWRIDGAIILARCTDATTDQIHQMEIPHVVINGKCPRGCCSVVLDDMGGTRIAMDYFRQLGHTKIAYSGPLPPYLAGHSSLQDRHDTYLSEIEDFNLEPIFGSHDTLGSAEDYLKEVVLEKGATAILAYGHMGALNLLQAAHSMEIPVPEKLSLMCFCDESAARIMSPGLTFIDLGSEKLGKIAAELLLDQIQHPGQVASQQNLLPEKLMVRSTTAPPYHQ